MGMPQIPDGKNRPNFDETMIDLLESIALEEMAIAHIINAEGEKMQEVIKQFAGNGLCYSVLENSCKNTQSMINSLIMKEWLLLNKMNSVFEMSNFKDQTTSSNTSNCVECGHYRCR